MIHHFLQKIQNWAFSLFRYILSIGANLDRADKFMADGQFLQAIKEIQRYIKRDSHNSNLFVVLANCYEQIGEKELSRHYAEIAYTLDDTFNSSIFHWARALVASNRCELALPLFALIKDNTPFAEGVNSELSGICMSLGDAYRAKEFQMTAWLSDFDSLRSANCYLFRLAYNDSDELLLAQEHQFWAETLKPKTVELGDKSGESENRKVNAPNATQPKPKSNKIRIGYWGGDFHEHSVRYFSRPLLENHDAERFEIFIYCEDTITATNDRQAKAFRDITNDFFEVYKLKNDDLEALIRSHDLDILVELMGHTSSNRVNLLQQKMAKVQITGLAYPPTTGHRSIDAKMVDVHIWTPDADQYYTEDPLIMPESLWCFDPMEEVAYAIAPPMLKNGFVTFGCFGNVAKITPPILDCWHSILIRLPNSRLIIQSTVLVDVATSTAFRKRLTDAGINELQIELRRPTFGSAFWSAYQDVDIILDTYPFNGGTTSCFAAYVGVPLLTWSGHSLISRVGRSIMCNLGYPEFVVNTSQDYVERAVQMANDAALIASFRRDAPKRFKASSLGDGKKFAKEFEAACEGLLKLARTNNLHSHSRVPPLASEVLLHRAQMVWYNGNVDAAARIVELCLRYYPDCDGAYLFKSRQLVSERRHQDAIVLLNQHFSKFDERNGHEALLLLARLHLIQGDSDVASQMLQQQALLSDPTSDHVMQAQLLAVALQPAQASDRYSAKTLAIQSILILVPCESALALEEFEQRARENCIHPDKWDIQYERCDLHDRLNAYNDVMKAAPSGILMIMQRNLCPTNPRLFLEVAAELEHCELLGCAGATTWRQKDWSLDAPAYKAWGLLRPSQEVQNMYELQFAGTDRRKVVNNAVVLDGKFLAFKPMVIGGVLFDEDLTDTQSLAEEDWSNRVHVAGHLVSIHRNLGLLISQSVIGFPAHSTQGQRRLLERLGLDPLSLSVRDFSCISVPVKSPLHGVEIADWFLT